MFISDEIPATFDRIAELSDNYVVLVKEPKLYTGSSYEAYVQYFSPSVLVVHLDDYKIKTGDSMSLDYTTNASGDLLSAEVSYELSTYELESRENGFYDRYDSPYILFHQFFILFLFVWVLNQMSKLVKKGGVFTS